jgi:DNA-binding transcriptional regulator YhcF (GntR family)
MDLSFLIPSKIRRAVLAYFVENPDAQVGIRELARELKVSPQLTYRELTNLESWGFLFSSKRGNQRAFRLNQHFPFYPPIRELFARYREEQNRRYDVIKTYDMKELVREIQKVPFPKELIPGLTQPRRKPRSYAEEKTLKRFGQL